MLYLLPTKRGIGVEFWGTYIDLKQFHETIGYFWNINKQELPEVAFESRNEIISGFSYEIRKAFEGKRLVRKGWHFINTEQEQEPQYLGAKISWIHILYSMSALKYNMQFYDKSKFDLAQILQVEHWLEKGMFSLDSSTAVELIPYIDHGITAENENIYLFMRYTNSEYISLGGGKKAFKKLPGLLAKGNAVTEEYKEYEKYLINQAKINNCDIADLDISDPDVNYDIKW